MQVMDMLGVIVGSALEEGEVLEFDYEKSELVFGTPRITNVKLTRNGEVEFEATPREIMTAFLDVMILRYPKTLRPRQTDTNAANKHGGSKR